MKFLRRSKDLEDETKPADEPRGRCPSCSGSGSSDRLIWDRCKMCSGAGIIAIRPWTEAERDVLRGRFEHTVSVTSIAVDLARPVQDVRGEALRLRLKELEPASYVGDVRLIGSDRGFGEMTR